MLTGNSYATEASTGRYDALTGLLLTGDGNGHFAVQKSVQTGFQADKDSKGLVELARINGAITLLVGTNNGPMESYQFTAKPDRLMPVQADAQYAILQTKSGKRYKQEFYNGQGYLSQSGWHLRVSAQVVAVTLVDTRGNSKNFLP